MNGIDYIKNMMSQSISMLNGETNVFIKYNYINEILDNLITKETMKTGIIYTFDLLKDNNNINNFNFKYNNLFLFPDLSQITYEFSESKNYKIFMKILSISLRNLSDTSNFIHEVNNDKLNEIFIIANIPDEQKHKFTIRTIYGECVSLCKICDNICFLNEYLKNIYHFFNLVVSEKEVSVSVSPLNILYNDFQINNGIDNDLDIDKFHAYYTIILLLYNVFNLICNKTEDLNYFEILSYNINNFNEKFVNNPLYEFFNKNNKGLILPSVII